MSKFLRQKQKQKNGGLFQNPLFYFGLTALFLWGMPFFSFGSLSELNGLSDGNVLISNSFFKNADQLKNNDLFFSQNNRLAKESPDFKIIQGNFVYGISTPRILTTQTLGSILGEPSHYDQKDEITEYIVEAGDTIKSLSVRFGISEDSIAQADGLSKNTHLKEGETLLILPVSGVLHEVKDGDTLDQIAKKYGAKLEDPLNYNDNDPNLYRGQLVVVPGGKIKQKSIIPLGNYASLPSKQLIFPLPNFKISKGLHLSNAVDLAIYCGAVVNASDSGWVQKRASDGRYGKYVVIKHKEGATYYGHLSEIRVEVGDYVNIGDPIGNVGKTGSTATGCHVHWQVMGGYANPLAKYPVNSKFVNGNLVK